MPKMTSLQSSSSFHVFERLYREALSKYLWTLLGALACMIAIAIMSSGQTYLMGPLIDKVFLAHDKSMLTIIAVSVLAIFAIRSAARYLQEVLLVSVGQKIVAYYQSRLFGGLIHQDVEDIRRDSAGKLAAVFLYDANMIRAAVCDVFLTAGKDSLTILTMIGLMFFTDWKMALMCLILPMLAIIPMKYLGRAVRKVSLRTQDEVAALTHTLNETFEGIRTVQALGLGARMKRKATGQMNALAKLVVKNAWVGGAILPVVDGIGGSAVAIVIIYGGAQVVSGALTPGELVVFVGAIVGAYAPIPSLSKTNATLQPGLAAAQRVFALIDRPTKLLVSEAAPDLARGAGSIRLEGVSFTYPETDKSALIDVNIIASAGQVTALVGRSGAGKSTILDIISRFCDPDQGRVLINGQDIRAVNPHSLRTQMAVMSQITALFDDTIANNIRIGRLNATDDEVAVAAQAVGMDAFITQLPQGFKTRIGPNGIGLSVGQAQRIGLARAFLRDAPILLFDEATSGQDAESEWYLQRSLRTLMQGRTTLIIAHRLETIRHADFIYVIDEGRIIEQGTHEDLLHKDGLYASLFSLQSTGQSVQEIETTII